LPIHVDPELGERAVTKALEVLARWKADAEDTEGHSRVMLAYLHGETELRFLDERLKYARRKFGAGEGLSSSRKPKITSRTSTQLATVNLD
jgi:hypothetical protein